MNVLLFICSIYTAVAIRGVHVNVSVHVHRRQLAPAAVSNKLKSATEMDMRLLGGEAVNSTFGPVCTLGIVQNNNWDISYNHNIVGPRKGVNYESNVSLFICLHEFR